MNRTKHHWNSSEMSDESQVTSRPSRCFGSHRLPESIPGQLGALWATGCQSQSPYFSLKDFEEKRERVLLSQTNKKTPEKTGEQAGRRHRRTSQRRQSQKPDNNFRGDGASPESDTGRMKPKLGNKKVKISLTLKQALNSLKDFLLIREQNSSRENSLSRRGERRLFLTFIFNNSIYS